MDMRLFNVLVFSVEDGWLLNALGAVIPFITAVSMIQFQNAWAGTYKKCLYGSRKAGETRG